MKKIIFLLLLITLSSVIRVHAVSNGDYLTFGKYAEEAINWRIIGETQDDFQLISHNIITFKELDSLYGDWKMSSLRLWLNSSDENIKYDSIPTYESEYGFLSTKNFSESELAIIVPTENMVVINENLCTSQSVGEEPHKYLRSIEYVDSDNRDNAYKELVTDKIFLPTISQLYDLELKSDIYGSQYSVATATQHAASEANKDYIREGKGWNYWLSDALSFSIEKKHMRVMSPENFILYEKCDNNLIGVRPMCRISKDKFYITAGMGTEDDPYSISTHDGISISYDGEFAIAGEELLLDVREKFDGLYKIKYYVNGVAQSGFPVVLIGENRIYCTAEYNNEIYKSNEIVINGISYTKLKETFYSDFNDGNLKGGFQDYYLNSEYANSVIIDSEHGLSFEAKSYNGFKASGRFPNFAYNDIQAVEFEFMVTENTSFENRLVDLRIAETDIWINPLQLKDGILSVNQVIGNSKRMNISPNVWYKVGIYYNLENSTLTATVKENNVTKVLCRDNKLVVEADYFIYGDLTASSNSSEVINTIYYDNVSTYSCVESLPGLNVTSVINDRYMDVTICNSSGKDEKITVYGVIYHNGCLEEIYSQEIELSQETAFEKCSYEFKKQGRIFCYVWRPDLTPLIIKKYMVSK